MHCTQVDAFTDRPFAGNPAAVCIMASGRSPAWMQHVAMEMNLSETAFVVPRSDGGFDLRWFTPAAEVDLCGHATLAAAHALWEDGHHDAEEARFHTLSGVLTARRQDGWIELDFPRIDCEAAEPPEALRTALGAEAVAVWRSRLDYVVELESEAAVVALAPDLGGLARLGTRGVIVTAAAEREGVDFVSRYFAPAFGIPEDPVTGSAHCCLGPYWGERVGKEELVGYQASARGGTVRVRLAGERVFLYGNAVTVLDFSLRIP